MYELLKNTAKRIIPKSLLRKNESFLRAIIALKYRGTQYECNVCGFQLSQFVQLSHMNEKLCPKCGSLPRTRRLVHLLFSEIGIKGKDILHFSPPKAINKKIIEGHPASYVTTDYLDEFEADKKLDITNIEEPDSIYDLIICYHVLEHIEADEKAMAELFRILKPNGLVLIQTPFKSGEIYEDYNIIAPEDRLKHFGQDDHVRIYSVAGLVERLEGNGFQLTVRRFDEEKDERLGLKKGEVVLLAYKK
jgi:SAM-dependent methyltransferase